MLRTDRDLEMFSDVMSTKIIQLEHILRTYVMYNFDLGMCPIIGESPNVQCMII